ncbi:aminodeoxychorismate synthase component I [Aromatoleum petrolei]|uniref:Aminodeoxychorismate synthase component I n=1 Tax=Aromatoleum petrolei TaxID=76116 RepID=A0ABX1MZT5_9RHOO|nr:aminodeoxychorismate synthase component I [Aromatoleum petrolei]NMF91464.1 aminodeoxychorismate synthase component I [Aromatoleum petrolei]QTQ34258.1 Putative aminodeoxychorismate synthase component I [Aromatoleum petrolei]
MIDSAHEFALFDDNQNGQGDLLLSLLEEIIPCSRADEVDDAFHAIERARLNGKWVAIAACYELGYALEPRLRGLLRNDGAPLLTAWVYGRAERLSPSETDARIAAVVARCDEHSRLGGVMSLQGEIAEEDYLRSVRHIRDYIAAGDCYQVNFTFALRGRLYGSPLGLYRALRAAQPVRHGALICHADGAVLSRSPELFVERRGDRLHCRPMKGTAARDTDPAALASSEKNRAENIMIVDLIRNDLGRLAPSGGVRVERLCEVEPYPSVWQMTSTVVAEPVKASIADVFRALFPCGSVTGAPKIRAMQIIHELETAPRGIYCGALGWIAPDGDFRFSVPIRTLEVSRDRDARLCLGSGIVADSEPAAEWAESLLKGRFLTDLRPPFGLIETLRCEPGAAEPYPLLARHFARLARSAAAFGFTLDVDAIRRTLLDQAKTLSGPQRVRVELAADGSFALAATPLEDSTAKTPTVIVSTRTISSEDPLLQHKTTARELYDAELRGAMAQGHFDALFFNERDELAEGARTNVYLDLGTGCLLTPPLHCGVLDGVYRRKLLDEGKAREQRLTRTDLSRARAILLSNAARGLFRVELELSG